MILNQLSTDLEDMRWSETNVHESDLFTRSHKILSSIRNSQDNECKIKFFRNSIMVLSSLWPYRRGIPIWPVPARIQFRSVPTWEFTDIVELIFPHRSSKSTLCLRCSSPGYIPTNLSQSIKQEKMTQNSLVISHSSTN